MSQNQVLLHSERPMITSHYELEFSNIFSDGVLHATDFTRPMNAQIAKLYVPVRGQPPWELWQQESDFLKIIRRSGGVLYLIGDAGTGKTSFLNGVFRFFRFYERSIGDLAKSGVPGPLIRSFNDSDLPLTSVQWSSYIDQIVATSEMDQGNLDVFQISLLPKGHSASIEDLKIDVFNELRKQILTVYRGLDEENEYAMHDVTRLNSGIQTDPSGNRRSSSPGSRIASLEQLKRDHDDLRGNTAGVRWTKLAFDYLTTRRTERRPLIVVIDDSDRLDPKVACDLQELILDAVFGFGGDQQLRPTVILALRPETARLRRRDHIAGPTYPENTIPLRRVAHNAVGDRRAHSLSTLVQANNRSFSEFIAPPGSNAHSYYWIESPAHLGHLHVNELGIHSQAVSGISTHNPETFTDVLSPLCEFSIRRRLWFQRALAQSRVIANRLSRGQSVSPRHLALGCFTGADGTAAILDNLDNVGCWYEPMGSTDSEFLTLNAIISFFVSGGRQTSDSSIPEDLRGGVHEISSRSLQVFVKTLKLDMNVARKHVARLVDFGYIDRPVNDDRAEHVSYFYRFGTVAALAKLLVDPFYMEVVSCFHLERDLPFWIERSSFEVDMRQRNRHILKVLERCLTAEAGWVASLQSIATSKHEIVFKQLESGRIFRLGKCLLRSLKTNCDAMLKWVEQTGVDESKGFRALRGLSDEARNIVEEMKYQITELESRFSLILRGSDDHWTRQIIFGHCG
jgi:hypothetical protein